MTVRSRTSKHILLTGATGFLGRRVVEVLARDGHELRALVRPSSMSRISSVAHLREANVDIRSGDLLDGGSIIAAADGIDVVCHLAAAMPRPGSLPAEMIRTNVVGARNVVNACVRRSVERLVMASSVAVYPTGLLGITERTPVAPRGPYILVARRSGSPGPMPRSWCKLSGCSREAGPVGQSPVGRSLCLA
jgi:nucleoside-diphosphate-sugar epimerase